MSNSTIHELTFDRCQKAAQHYDRCRAERNYTRCKYEHMYNWKGLNESAFPAHLYIFRDQSVNFTIDHTQGVFIDKFHSIDPTKNSQFQSTNISHPRFS